MFPIFCGRQSGARASKSHEINILAISTEKNAKYVPEKLQARPCAEASRALRREPKRIERPSPETAGSPAPVNSAAPMKWHLKIGGTRLQRLVSALAASRPMQASGGTISDCKFCQSKSRRLSGIFSERGTFFYPAASDESPFPAMMTF
jgi:hypothetical protein